MRFYELGKRKVEVFYCSEPIPWEAGGKSGVYFKVYAKIQGLFEEAQEITSNVKVAPGEKELNILLAPGNGVIKVKIKEDQTPAKERK